MKVLLLATTVIIVLGTGIAVLSGLIGETSRGKTLAQAFGIPRPAVIAHRGASYLAPEETRPAFLMADYLEFDIQRRKDGVLIALHDDDLSRTTNVAEIFPGREKDTIDTFSFAELAVMRSGLEKCTTGFHQGCMKLMFPA